MASWLEKGYKERLTVTPLGVSSKGACLNEQVTGGLMGFSLLAARCGGLENYRPSLGARFSDPVR